MEKSQILVKRTSKNCFLNTHTDANVHTLHSEFSFYWFPTQTSAHQEQHSAVVQGLYWKAASAFQLEFIFRNAQAAPFTKLPHTATLGTLQGRSPDLSPAMAVSRNDLPLQKMHTAAKCHTSTSHHLLWTGKNTRHSSVPALGCVPQTQVCPGTWQELLNQV